MTTPIKHRPASPTSVNNPVAQTTPLTQITAPTQTANAAESTPTGKHPRDFFDDAPTNPRALEVSDAGKPLPAGDAELSSQLASQRAARNASGYGRGHPLRLNANNVSEGEDRARGVRNQRIDWSDPSAALNNLSQVDSTTRTNDDLDRCGAAAIGAGSILRGPDSTNAAVGRLRSRVDTLRQELNDRGEPADSSIRQRLDAASANLERLGGRNAHTWRNGDGTDFQEAIYDVARADTLMRVGNNAPAGLPPETVRQYRDLTWGAERNPDGQYQTMTPQYALREGDARRNIPVDIHYRGDGHFVLAQGRPQRGGRDATGAYDAPSRDISSGGNRIVFDSFPRGDGSAYSQATDGRDERLQPNLSPDPQQRPSRNRERFSYDVDQVQRLDRMGSTVDRQRLLDRGD